MHLLSPPHCGQLSLSSLPQSPAPIAQAQRTALNNPAHITEEQHRHPSKEVCTVRSLIDFSNDSFIRK